MSAPTTLPEPTLPEAFVPVEPGSAEPAEPTTERKPDISTEDLIVVLRGYNEESKEGRRSGPSGRDDVWDDNIELYWNRMNFEEKAPWQAQYVLPEFSNFIDRFAASISQALVRAGQWYEVRDPGDPEGLLVPFVKRVLRIALERCGENAAGHDIDFSGVFETVIRLGTLLMPAASVTWRDGKLRIDPVDARELYYDPSGRGLYRRRRMERERHDLERLGKLEDSEGRPLYDREAIERLQAFIDEELKDKKERMAGHDQDVTAQGRTPIVLDEYLGDLIDSEGKLVAENQLVIMANEREIIRGPEPNPFWHEKDWIVATPMIPTGVGVYGKTYGEQFASVARLFTDLSNLILDGTFTTTMQAFVGKSASLVDPTQLRDGIRPSKFFDVEEDEDIRNVIRELPLGQIPAGSVSVWQGIKGELREGANQSELSLGQVASKGDVTATEAQLSQASASSLVSSIAKRIETHLLDPILDLAWWTSLQHMDPERDPAIEQELGAEMAEMLRARRADFRSRRFKIRSHGITGVIQRQQDLTSLIRGLSVISKSEVLMQAFLQRFDAGKLIDAIFRGVGIDTGTLRRDPEEAAAAAAAPPQPAAAPGVAPGGNGADAAALLASLGAGGPGPPEPAG